MKLSNKRKNINPGIFHIRLGAHLQKINLKDPVFLRILQQQYATKYLQSMGVQATSKNIAKILKQRPLDSCQIVESRLSGGLHTDTITVITSSHGNNVNSKATDSQTVSNQMLKILDLKKMAQKKDQKSEQKKLQTLNTRKLQNNNEQKGLFYLDFNIKSIKSRYIFPFNENFVRKNNYKLRDLPNLIDKDTQQSKLIFEAHIFKFPFTQIKLTLNTLKQLQAPITVKLSDTINFLQGFYSQFPKQIFPTLAQKKGLHKEIHITFDNKAIEYMFSILRSEENAKFIGIFLHLGYWAVFGAVNPLQIDSGMKRKMFIMIQETIKYFQLKTEVKKTWISLVQPMVILTLKMALDYFFHLQYPKLFFSQQSIKVGANQLAFDKILLFVDKILDQSNINGRFIFLQSDIDGPKGNFMKDKKFIRKRIFGTSPALQMILPQPKDGKARSIIAKNIQIDQKDGTLDQNLQLTYHQQDKQCRQKLLNLALLKIRNRIQQVTGPNLTNPIIRLQDKD